ncbi:E3 ubiquitin/ISG15 ligase TRIM25 isoform X2 [Equus caballus]|uniref:RING-type E3 ubiquitin transferase n=1 Tax=Equus caballus TaxID=9796 RepID=A0A5F5PXY1_HORSE|nr:E3 ubiquitin/ISG15 ligase TRIM25 isoform X2 [Equus caballus]
MTEQFTLAEELSCSICLEPFKEPVTTPCGHNFCGACLDASWASRGAPYGCPQCRTVYQARPQLRKNTVLCAVVEQFLQAKLTPEELPDGCTPPAGGAAHTRVKAGAKTPAKVSDPVAQVICDHCLKEAAVKTCLMCMASFCQEHLQPHLDSPAFRDHPLQPPIGDLIRRKCPQHNRLRDFFCPEHGECICHICLVEHKSCSPAPLSQASADLENKLKHKLTVMYGQINGASRALEDVRARQQDVRETTQRRMEQLREEFTEMKALISALEAKSIQKIEEEEKRVSSKFDHSYQVLLKKKSEIQNLKEETELALNKGDEFEFLEKAAKLQGVSTKPVYVPKVELNQELIKGVCQGTLDLKNELKRYIQQSQDKKPHEPPVSAPPRTFPFEALELIVDSKEVGLEAGAKTTTPQANSMSLRDKVLEAFLAKSRPELLKYAGRVILDCNTAHSNVALSKNYTVASVADVPQSYRPHPQRFTYCSQVLGLHCYKEGIHYWEVELRKNNCGVGICYGSMQRQGPESRLGRNSSSWCVEQFNTKISAWHKRVEKTLPFKATRVGVLLNCDYGFVIFFAVTDKVHLMYAFKVDFTEALYPAFWVFSAGATLSICSSK